MKKIKKAIAICVILGIIGCSSYSQKAQIQKYGVEKFTQDTLSFIKTNAIHPEIQKEFKPKEIKLYLNGVLLVYSETNKYIEGIYVENGKVDSWGGGSGLEISPWFDCNQIAWVKIKKRQIAS